MSLRKAKKKKPIRNDWLLFRLFFLSTFFLRRVLFGGWIMQGRPAEKLYQKDTDKGTDTIDTNITPRAASCTDKGLMIFIESGKANTDDSGEKHKPEASDAIYIKRKRNSNCKKKIFGHMSCFSYIVFNRKSFIIKFIVAFVCTKYFILRLNNLQTDFIT